MRHARGSESGTSYRVWRLSSRGFSFTMSKEQEKGRWEKKLLGDVKGKSNERNSDPARWIGVCCSLDDGGKRGKLTATGKLAGEDGIALPFAPSFCQGPAVERFATTVRWSYERCSHRADSREMIT